MGTEQLLSPLYPDVVSSQPRRCTDKNVNVGSAPVFMSPAEFKMKLMKRIVSVDGANIDKRSVKSLQRSNSDRTMKASILFPNGDVGTIISLERLGDKKDEKETDDNNNTASGAERVSFPSIRETDYFDNNGLMHPAPRKERPLRLPPIQLPRIYTLKPLPILPRDFESATLPPRPITDEEWEDLKECRYLRPSPRKYRNYDSKS